MPKKKTWLLITSGFLTSLEFKVGMAMTSWRNIVPNSLCMRRVDLNVAPCTNASRHTNIYCGLSTADIPGKRVLYNIYGGPGRLDEGALADSQARGIYLFPDVQNTTQVTQ
jgi:hypothetical protein